MKGDVLSGAISCAPDRTGDVRTVAIAVVRAVAVINSSKAVSIGAATKLRVRSADARVDNVDMNASSRWRVVILAVQGTITLVNSIETRSTKLKVSLRGSASSTLPARSRIRMASWSRCVGVNIGDTALRWALCRG